MDYSMERGKNKSKKKKKRLKIICIFLILVLFIVLAAKWLSVNYLPEYRVKRLTKAELPDWVDVQIIEVDGHSRRGEKLEDIKDIVIHYVGNPGTTAQQNHDYYTNPDSTVSSHFIIGLDGEIIQCVPLDEKSSASNWRNNDTISIEVCHPDDTGEFTDATYSSLIRLTAWLSDYCHLKESNIIRHYDITGKECPRYFVQHEDKWEQFKKDVTKYRKSN